MCVCVHVYMYVYVCVCTQSLKLCTSLRPMDWGPPGSSVQGIFQARILEWVTTSSYSGSSDARGRTHISCVSCIDWWILSHSPIYMYIYSLPR